MAAVAVKIDALLANQGADEDLRQELCVEACEHAGPCLRIAASTRKRDELLIAKLGGLVEVVTRIACDADVPARGGEVLGENGDAIGEALGLRWKRGVEALGSSYSNGWTPADVIAHVSAVADPAAVRAHLHVATLRQGADDTWSGGAPFANHAKLVIADARTFYLGSQNWYPANLVELGYIIDDAAVTAQLLAESFAPAWTMSSRMLANC